MATTRQVTASSSRRRPSLTAEPSETKVTLSTATARARRSEARAASETGADSYSPETPDDASKPLNPSASAQGAPVGTRITLRMRHKSADEEPQPAPPPPNPAQVKADGLALLKRLVEFEDRHGQTHSAPFMKLPSRKEYPDYYEFIRRPISFNEVKTKLSKAEYESMRKVGDDLKQVFINAKRYNQQGSDVFASAKILHKFLKQEWAVMHGQPREAESDHDAANSDPGSGGEEEPKRKKIKLKLSQPSALSAVPSNDAAKPTPEQVATPTPDAGNPDKTSDAATKNDPAPPTIKSWLRGRLAALDDLREAGSGRKFISAFETLPDRVDWKSYYDVVLNPCSFDVIRVRPLFPLHTHSTTPTHVFTIRQSKNERRLYKDIQSFIADVELVLNNAIFFNEDGSQIWRDAKSLLKKVEPIMKDVPSEFAQPVKRGPYTKTRDRLSNQESNQDEAASPGQADLPEHAELLAQTAAALNGIPPDGHLPQALTLADAALQRSATLMNPMVTTPSALAAAHNLARLSSIPIPGVRGLPLAQQASGMSFPNHLSHMNTIPNNMMTVNGPPSIAMPQLPSVSSGLGREVLVNGATRQGTVTPINQTPMDIVPVRVGTPPTPVRVVSRLPEHEEDSAISKFKVITVPAATLPLILRNDIVRQHALTVPRVADRLYVSPSLRVIHPPRTLKSKLRSADTSHSESNGTGGSDNVDRLSASVAQVIVTARPKQCLALPLGGPSASTNGLVQDQNGQPSTHLEIKEGAKEVIPMQYIVELGLGLNVVEFTTLRPSSSNVTVTKKGAPPLKSQKSTTSLTTANTNASGNQGEVGELNPPMDKEVYRLFVTRSG